MNKSEIIESIADLEEVINDPQTTAGEKADLQPALDKLRGKLAAIEAEEHAAEKPKPAAKTPAKAKRADIYAHLLKAHPGMTKAQVEAMSTKDYDQLHAAIAQDVKEAFPNNAGDAKDIADVFLNSKLPAGEAAPKKEGKKPAEAPKKATKKKQVITIQNLNINEADSEETTAFTCEVLLDGVKICQAKNSGKGGGNIYTTFAGHTSKDVEALKAIAKAQTGKDFEPLDYLIYELMDKAGKSKKAKPPHTYDWMTKIGENERTRAITLPGKYYLHVLDYDSRLKTRGVDVPLKKGDGLLLNEQGFPMTFLVASQIEKQTRPFKQPDSAPAKNDPKPAPAKEKAASKTTEPAPEKPKRASCTREQGNVARLSAKLKKWVDDNTWDKFFKKREIKGVFYTHKEDKARILVKIKDWSMTKTEENWYVLCPDTWNMTKVEAPAANSYRRIVSEDDLKKIYTTKGEKVYYQCIKVYRSFYECSKEGSCSADDKKKIQDAWHTCGDLTKKKEVVPAWMKSFHEEVKKQRKQGESYTDAMSRVAKSLNT